MTRRRFLALALLAASLRHEAPPARKKGRGDVESAYWEYQRRCMAQLTQDGVDIHKLRLNPTPAPARFSRSPGDPSVHGNVSLFKAS